MIRVLETRVPAQGPGAAPQVSLLCDAQAEGHVGRPEQGTTRWIDVVGQTQAELDLLGRTFGFHPLTLEDCLHFDQRPKLEEYTGTEPYLFLVIHNFSIQKLTDGSEAPDISLVVPASQALEGDDARLLVEPQEVHAFLGPGYLVTIHQRPSPPLEAIWRRVQGEPALLQRGSDFVYYQVADMLCDSNFPVLEQLGDLLDDIEEAVLAAPMKKHLDRIYQMRKVLVTMRRVLSPQRDILALLSRHGGGPCVSSLTAPYFRDVHDHLMRISEAIESGRDLLGNCVDAYLSAVGQRTNEIMKQLTILSAVMLPLTFISGFFGMNFKMLPIGSYPLYYTALALMFVVVPAGMLGWFRYKRWL